jgi:hypothetical protein
MRLLLLLLALTFAGCKNQPPVQDLPVASAPSLHGSSSIVSFRDGTLRPDLHGKSDRKPVYHVVPVVPDGWTKEQPVTLWVLCQDGPKAGRCDDPTLWLESLSAQPLPLKNAKVIPHGDVTKPNTGWHSSVRDAETRHGIRSDPRAVFVTVEEPAAWTPSHAPPAPPPTKGPVVLVIATIAVTILVMIAMIGGNVFAVIRYEADRKKQGAPASRRALGAWAAAALCPMIWPTIFVVSPLAIVLSILELRAIRRGTAPAASRIPAVAAIVNGVGWVLLVVGGGGIALVAMTWGS